MPSEDVLRGLLEAAPDALLAIDSSGVIVFVSDEAARLFDWAQDDLIGQQVECLVPERFRTHHPALRGGYVDRPVTRPMGAGLDLWARRRDGSEFPAEISLSALDATSGTIVAVAIRDVTVARRSEQRLRAVLASAPDAIVGVDGGGRIALLNEQAERLFGWSRDELLGQQVEALVPLDMRDRHVHHRATFVAEPSARPMGAGLQLAARRKDGSSFPAEISLSAVEEDDGVMVLAAVRDVTERVELEAERRRQAVEAQREQSHRLESIGQLAGGVAHDFNNLLGVILNYSTLLSRRLTDETDVADLGEIRAAAERAAALTRQLLAFARREVANPEPLQVNVVVRTFSTLLERTLGEHIDLRLRLAADDPVVVIDRHQLEQILLNLALNGRDAMRSGGALTIITSLAGAGADRVLVQVIDTGHGMEADVMARAFEPFYTTKGLGEGTGLGLATVFGIVRQNRGEVTIQSTVGEGTTVSVDLPRVRLRPVSVATEEEASEGGHERILLVEDEAALRLATQRILVDQGYEVVSACDGVEALEMVARFDGSIDLVVSDVAMPRMRGDQMARELARTHPLLPVVFMSGYDSGNYALPGRLLEKPVSEAELLRVVREALDG